MAIYKCKCGASKEIDRATIVYREGKWETLQGLCKCGLYMDSEPKEGFPTLKRTEPTLRKKRDKLWDGAKEKLIGERGINEDF